jgi:hypothetical protein
VFIVYWRNYRENLPTENSVGKNDTSSFFLLCFKFFSHGNSVGIYQENISVGKIPRKFTDKNILSIFLFIFINFLIVKGCIINAKYYKAHISSNYNMNALQSFYFINYWVLLFYLLLIITLASLYFFFLTPHQITFTGRFTWHHACMSYSMTWFELALSCK